MIRLLRDKKVIFFDVGYTLDKPASGDWMLTGKFLEKAGARMKERGEAEKREAMEAGLRFLEQNHLVKTVDEEIRQFCRYYSILSDHLRLGLTETDCEQIAQDRACCMKNYVPYPGITEVMATLCRTHRLGVISDTWPSIERQLEYIGVSRYLSFCTFSCFLGVFKPDRRMYLDALEKSGVNANETVFIDDSARNLRGAAELGITPVLIAADTDAETDYPKIHDLRELIL